MVNNYICESCDKVTVCDRVKILDKFLDDVKKPLGIDITLNNCREFKQVEEE